MQQQKHGGDDDDDGGGHVRDRTLTRQSAGHAACDSAARGKRGNVIAIVYFGAENR